MIPILPVLLKDGYKVGHKDQYPPHTSLIYSNMTPRASRVPGVPGIISFALQYFVQEYLIRQFQENFFDLPREEVMKKYQRRLDAYLGPGGNYGHIGELHELGYLPLEMKGIPEGTLVPFRVPVFTVRNTLPEFSWLTNMLETLDSCILWGPMTSATTAARYRKVFDTYAEKTGSDPSFVSWQGHDFSFRGKDGLEGAILSAAAHLIFFTGTDTIPAIDFLEAYYDADCEKELIGGSVPATEHSVVSMGGQEGEEETIRRLLKVYPAGILSFVSDTWDFWGNLTTILPKLKPEIMARNGKYVVRPDSGDPVLIICGDDASNEKAVREGAIQTLWNLFGGVINEKGFKVLDPHIGLIYGDSITPERQIEILERLKAKGFASSNVVLGIGSYTYQYVTRDTYGFAMKATYGETTLHEGGIAQTTGHAIFKKPATDNGVKNSAKGLLSVHAEKGGKLSLSEDQTWTQEGSGMLDVIFRNGKAFNRTTLAHVRRRAAFALRFWEGR